MRCPCCHQLLEYRIWSYEGKWKRWFAWHPVKINNKWVWWNWVERQEWGYYSENPESIPLWHYNYRFINK